MSEAVVAISGPAEDRSFSDASPEGTDAGIRTGVEEVDALIQARLGRAQ